MYKVTVFESAKELLNAAATDRPSEDTGPVIPANVYVNVDISAAEVTLRQVADSKEVKKFDVSALTPSKVLEEYGKAVGLPLKVTHD